MKELVCDRIEGDLAVFVDEEGHVLTLPLSQLSRPPHEGDVYTEDLVYDPQRTQARHARISALFMRRKKKQKG